MHHFGGTKLCIVLFACLFRRPHGLDIRLMRDRGPSNIHLSSSEDLTFFASAAIRYDFKTRRASSLRSWMEMRLAGKWKLSMASEEEATFAPTIAIVDIEMTTIAHTLYSVESQIERYNFFSLVIYTETSECLSDFGKWKTKAEPRNIENINNIM